MEGGGCRECCLSCRFRDLWNLFALESLRPSSWHIMLYISENIEWKECDVHFLFSEVSTFRMYSNPTFYNIPPSQIVNVKGLTFESFLQSDLNIRLISGPPGMSKILSRLHFK